MHNTRPKLYLNLSDYVLVIYNVDAFVFRSSVLPFRLSVLPRSVRMCPHHFATTNHQQPTNRHTVFRIDKLKPHITKLCVPANAALDVYELEELRRAAMPPPQRSPSRSPSPQPGDVNYVDPDFDPDNAVVRGAATDDEADSDENVVRKGQPLKGGNALDDFTFNTHS